MQSLRPTATALALARRGLSGLASTAAPPSRHPSPCLSKEAPTSLSSKILLKPFPHAALTRLEGNFFGPGRHDVTHRCEDFNLILKPFPSFLVDGDGNVDEAQFLPHWLPMPPDPSTHQRRHLRSSLYRPASPQRVVQDPGDRWKSLPPPHPASDPKQARPIMRLFVLSTKKRIHKLAVIRHRARTRLVAALRTAMHNHPNADLASVLDHRKKMFMLVASPSAYLRPMEELVAEFEKALSTLTKPKSKKHGGPARRSR